MSWIYQPNKFVFLFISLIWILVISSFSTTSFSASNTASYIENFLHNIFPTLDITTIRFIHIMIRKTAHFTEFGILAILIFGIFTAKEQIWKLRWLVYTLFMITSIALLDEYHQGFVRNRNASLEDSLLDISGGITVLLIILLIKKNKFFKAEN